MLKKFFPKQEDFFQLFDQMGKLLVACTLEFQELIADPQDAKEKRCMRLKEWEHQADTVTHDTYDLLHKTFITPFGREDIYNLISGLDDIIDLLEAAGQRIYLYDISDITPEIHELTAIVLAQTKLLETVVRLLRNLKEPTPIIQTCIEIKRLENDADQVYQRALARLFRDEEDLRTLIKLKDIYYLLEAATDACDKVANIIDSIVLDYA